MKQEVNKKITKTMIRWTTSVSQKRIMYQSMLGQTW